jgi:transposase-like protein
MLERDVEVSHETIRLWTLKFGAEYARRLRRREGRCGDTWYIDEVFCKINGRQAICGARLTRTAKYSIFWYSSGATPKPRSASSESC